MEPTLTLQCLPPLTQAILERILPRDLASIAHGYIIPSEKDLALRCSAIDAAGYVGHGELFGQITKTRDLHGACSAGHIELVRWAITYISGITLSSSTTDYTCLNAAFFEGHADIARLLTVSGAAIHSLYWPCAGGITGIIDMAIDSGACDWDIGLAAACLNKQDEAVKMMIKHGAKCCYQCGRPAKEHSTPY